jgi:hypothetical protein
MVASKHGMSGRLEPVRFPDDPLGFFMGIAKISARARARGEFGSDGQPVWSVNEWKAFCRGARAYRHMPFLGNGIVNTVHEVEACIEDGYEAIDIHNILLGAEAERERRRIAQKNVELSIYRPLRSVA